MLTDPIHLTHLTKDLLWAAGEAGTGNVVEAVRHCRAVMGAIKQLQTLDEDEIYVYAKVRSCGCADGDKGAGAACHPLYLNLLGCARCASHSAGVTQCQDLALHLPWKWFMPPASCSCQCARFLTPSAADWCAVRVLLCLSVRPLLI